MLTPNQLTRIEWLIKSFTKGHISKDDYSEVLEFVPDMLTEITRLQTALTAKDETLDQIDTITKRLELKVNGLETNINSLVEAIKVKDSVLAQFSDAGNWGTVAMYNSDNEAVDLLGYAWLSDNPTTLANQALMAGHEQ